MPPPHSSSLKRIKEEEEEVDKSVKKRAGQSRAERKMDKASCLSVPTSPKLSCGEDLISINEFLIFCL